MSFHLDPAPTFPLAIFFRYDRDAFFVRHSSLGREIAFSGRRGFRQELRRFPDRGGREESAHCVDPHLRAWDDGSTLVNDPAAYPEHVPASHDFGSRLYSRISLHIDLRFLESPGRDNSAFRLHARF